MQTVLPNLLKSHAPLAALVADRIDWDEIPQGLAKPAIVIFVISGPRLYTQAGANRYVANRLQFDCLGKTAAEARQVAAALEAKLSGYRGVHEGIHFQGCFQQNERTRGRSDAAKWFTNSRDFMIHWAPA